MATLTETKPPETTATLGMHKDGISASELDLKNPYVASAVGLFAIHNVIRRNLASCAEHAAKINQPNAVAAAAALSSYASYTLYVLEDQLDSVDTLWFPKFEAYDARFRDEIEKHQPILKVVNGVKPLVANEKELVDNSASVAQYFEQLSQTVNEQFDQEEELVNQLGDKVPLEEIRELEKKQEERRGLTVKKYGQLWTAVYLLRGLAPKERAIFPPGIPRFIVSGMLTSGALQFRKQLQFAPKF